MAFLNRTELHAAVAGEFPGMRSRNSFEKLLPLLPYVQVPGIKTRWYDLEVVIGWIRQHMIFPAPAVPSSLHRTRPRRAST